MNTRLDLTVTGVRCEARDVLVLELRDASGATLPPFSPGAHLEMQLPGAVRHYSLCNDSTERHRYCVGIGLAKDSRGGSKHIHESVRVGSKLSCSAPRNNFPFDTSGDDFLFVAGGIGITPILSMIRQCVALNKSWRLYYCTRSRHRTAFYEDLYELGSSNCHFHFDDEAGGALFDASVIGSHLTANTHLYCCGPAPLMNAVREAAANHSPDRLHFEWFTPQQPAVGDDRPFIIKIHSTGQRLEVPAGKSILDVLEANELGVPYSCREGLCATCMTPVLSGIPDHRDSVLSNCDRTANNKIVLCVSRAQTDELELDL